MKRTILILLLLASTVFAFSPGTYNLVMQAGEDFAMTLALADTNGAAVNITGNSYAAQFRSAPAPGGIVFASYSVAVTSPTHGQISMKLSSGQTTRLSGRTGVWDLRQTDTSNQKSYLLTGTCQVKPTATR